MDEREDPQGGLEGELMVAKVRIANLEARMNELERRLLQANRPFGAPASPPPPPPPQAHVPEPFWKGQEKEPQQPTFEFPTIPGPPPPQYGPKPPPTPPKPKRDIELELGAKVLPWAGALVVVVALGFLTAMGIERGFFTPIMQFIGAMVLSLAFLGVGYAKRGERQDFGLLLMGIGSCGVYLSLAGGHLVHDLYTGEVLVASFMAWSLCNLGFGAKTGSRSFVALGFVGGLISSLFTTQRLDFPLQCALHFLSLTATLVVIARRGWHFMLWPAWLLGAGALLYGGKWEWIWWIPSLAFAAHGLAIVAADLFTEKPPKWGLALSPLALAAISPYVFNRELTLTSCGFVFGVGVIALALTGLRRAHPHALFTACAGAALCLLVAPIGLDPVPQCLTQVGVAIACALLYKRIPKQVALGFGWSAFALAILPYGDFVARANGTADQELAMLASLVVSTVILCFAAAKAFDKGEFFFLSGSMLLAPMLARMAILGIPQSPAHYSFAILAMCSSLGMTFLANPKWQGPPILARFTLAVAGFYALIVPPPTELIVTAIGLVIVGSIPNYRQGIRTTAKINHEPFRLCFGGAVAVLAVPFVYHALSFVQIKDFMAVQIALASVGLGFTIGAALYKKGEPAWVGLFVMVIGVLVSFIPTDSQDATLAVQAILAVGLIATWVVARYSRYQRSAQVIVELMGWLVATLVGRIVFDTYLRFPFEWAVTIAWGIYAGLLLIIGAIGDQSSLRMAGLAVFGITLVKVLGYDLLLKVDPLLRVAVLLALGLALLGGGYYYIRRRKEDVKEPEPLDTQSP